MTITDLQILDLLHIGSPALPVGAYAFSNGLEYAIDAGWLRSDAEVSQWLSDQLSISLAQLDVPVLLRLHASAQAEDWRAFWYWNDYLLASRESAELQLSDTATGAALVRLLPQLDIPVQTARGPVSFAAALAQFAVNRRLTAHACALVYCWSWLENQVTAATKLMPLGQTRAQMMLARLRATIPGVLERAADITDPEIGCSLPGLALSGMQHETQYTRLFRS